MVKSKISIITACLNNVESIEKTISSVLSQDYCNVEYIIIDGGSTDGTVDVIKKYNEKLFYWISEKDSGIANAWNKGLAVATGEIIGIINADDWYEPGAFRAIGEALGSNQQHGFAFGDLNYFESKDDHFICTYKGSKQYTNKIEFMMTLLHPTVFVRKSIYDHYGDFNEEYKIALDYEFLLRIYCHGVLGIYVPRTIANMRNDGVSERNILKAYKEVLKASLVHVKKKKAYYYYGKKVWGVYKKMLKAKLT